MKHLSKAPTAKTMGVNPKVPLSNGIGRSCTAPFTWTECDMDKLYAGGVMPCLLCIYVNEGLRYFFVC